MMLITYLSLIGRHGNCLPYRPQDRESMCDRFYTPEVDFVYVPHDRNGDFYLLLRSLNQAFDLIQSNLEDCNGLLLVEVLCHFLFPPCGNVSVLEPPTSVCEEVCLYAVGLCSEQIQPVLELLEQNSIILGVAGLTSINCSNTGEYLEPLPHCCSYFGAEIRKSVLTLSVIRSL